MTSAQAGKAVAAPDAGWRRCLLLAALLLAVLALYLYPLYDTRAAVGASPLPPLFAPDLYLYLNLSQLQAVTPHVVANPWYGLPVPAAAIAYKKFGLSFLLLAGLRSAVGGSWFAAVALWTVLWTALIFLAAVWFFRRMLPEPCGLLLFLALALLLLVDMRSLPLLPAAWLHLPSLRGFEGMALPYIREFFPQVVVPLVLIYLALQAEALRARRWTLWLVMAAVQLLAFALYPYAMLLMAGTTGVTLLLALAARRLQPSYPQVLAFGALCAALDAVYLWAVGGASAYGSSGTLVAVSHAALFLHLLRSKTVLLLALVTAVVSAARDPERPQVKWTLVALGGSNILLLVADAVLPIGLQVSHHALYLVHTTLAIQVAYLLAMLYSAALKRSSATRWAAAAVLTLVMVQGRLAAQGNVRAMLSFNRTQREAAELLRPFDLQKDDLVIAPARYVDDTSSWVPLLTRAQVLYSRNAEFVLTPEDEDRVQGLRQALYLYFTGWDAAAVERALAPAGDFRDQDFLSLTQQRILLEGPDRQAALEALKARILPALARVEQHDPEVQQLLRGYRRILVIDRADAPVFPRSRLAAQVEVVGERRWVGNSVLIWCKPR